LSAFFRLGRHRSTFAAVSNLRDFLTIGENPDGKAFAAQA
jgi:hypothetical protein